MYVYDDLTKVSFAGAKLNKVFGGVLAPNLQKKGRFLGLNVESDENWSNFGINLSVSDVNGDNYDDIIIAEEKNDPNEWDNAIYII